MSQHVGSVQAAMPDLFRIAGGTGILWALVAALVASVAARADSPAADTLVIPFRNVGHTPLVQIEAAGRKWNFVVDTGAGSCLCSPAFALETLGLTAEKAKHREDFFGAVGDTVNLPEVTLPLLRLSGKSFVNVPMAVADCEMMGSALGIPIDGLLGYPLFHGFRLTVDYPASQIRLSPTNVVHTDAGYEFPYVLSEDVPYVAINFQERSMEFLLDTGNGASLDLPAEKLGLRLVSQPWSGGISSTLTGNKPARKARQAGTLLFGGVEFIEPTVGSMPDHGFYIGGQILEHFSVTFDPLRQRVEFVPNQPGPVRLPPIYETDVKFDRTARPWRVLYVAANNPELRRQVQIGDRCVRLNGELVSAWTPERFETYRDRTNTLRCTLVRNGKEFEGAVPVFVAVP
jgi:hypothetical protein